MKVISVCLVVALLFGGIYAWFFRNQIDQAALNFSLAALMYNFYLDNKKRDEE